MILCWQHLCKWLILGKSLGFFVVRYRLSRIFCLNTLSRTAVLFISLSDTGSFKYLNSLLKTHPCPTARSFYLHIRVKPVCACLAFPRCLSEWRFADCSFPYVMKFQLARAALPRTEPCSGSFWKDNSCMLSCVTYGEIWECSNLLGPAWSTDIYYREHIKKHRHYFANKGPFGQGCGFSSSHVWMWELDYKESWALKNWCFWTVVLEKTPESPLDSKEIQPVHPKGNQSWMFIGRTDVEAETPILWPPDTKSWLIWKDSDAGKDWRQVEKATTEDEMVGWHHRLNGHEVE